MKKPLEVIGLSKTYNTKEAVKEVSFKVNQNEIIGILGPNGCCLLYTSPSPRD